MIHGSQHQEVSYLSLRGNFRGNSLVTWFGLPGFRRFLSLCCDLILNSSDFALPLIFWGLPVVN